MIPMQTIDRVVAAIRQDLVDQNLHIVTDDPIKELEFAARLAAIGGVASGQLFLPENKDDAKAYDKKQNNRWLEIIAEEFGDKYAHTCTLSFVAGRNWAVNQHAKDIERLSDISQDM